MAAILRPVLFSALFLFRIDSNIKCEPKDGSDSHLGPSLAEIRNNQLPGIREGIIRKQKPLSHRNIPLLRPGMSPRCGHCPADSSWIQGSACQGWGVRGLPQHSRSLTCLRGSPLGWVGASPPSGTYRPTGSFTPPTTRESFLETHFIKFLPGS